MSRKQNTGARVRGDVAARKKPAKKTKQADDDMPARSIGPLTPDEEMSLVCQYFCRGNKVADIQDLLKKKHGLILNREKPYRLLARATERNLLKYYAPLDMELAERLRDRYRELYEFHVVHTATFDDVANRAATAIIQVMRGYRKQNRVHIGFAGGPSMRILARHLAEQLYRPQPGLPDTIHLHALVSGFDPHDPTTDPNTFFTYFLRRSGMPLQVEFVGLHAPALAAAKDYDRLRKMPGIREAFEAAGEIDLFVTSGSQWTDEHSLLQRSMKKVEGGVDTLEAAGCVGDILWRPLGPRAPIEIETDTRAMTLVELGALPGLIEDGRQVMLVLGSCGGCDNPKGKLLNAVLNQTKPLVTHVVVDSRTVVQALDG